MAEVFSDFAKSTLSASINASVTSIDVIDGSKFPAPTGGDFFFAAIVEGSTIEIVKVTARTLENMTVVRAQGGTVAAAFSSGALVSHRAFAETYETLAAGGGGGGGSVGRTFRTAEHYAGDGLETSASTPAADTIYATGFEIHAARAFDRLGVEVTTAQAGSTIRLGIYNDASGYPSSRLVDAGTVDSSTIGSKEATIAQTLQPGMYWLAYKAEGTAPTVRGYAGTEQSQFMPVDNAGAGEYQGWGKAAQTSGALADPFPSAGNLISANCPRIWLRAT